MNTFHKLGLCALGCALGFASGCDKQQRAPETARNRATYDPDRPLPASETSGVMTPASRTWSATEQIARSRCEREQECGNIGPDKTFSTSQDCLVRIENDWKEELNARQCPGGINQKELNECLEQVRGEDCANPFHTLARITECTSGQICIEDK
ncbi:MAG TPA: DUF6184 family natural product biosynthesis lipoprotein [Polyangiaceae bacterium]|nr:DUF6184 family natural product biosynthesis lipoprotein [Polyangiaceae bacterium]